MNETIGIVGLGAIAGHHAHALEKTPGVDIIGGVDSNANRHLSIRDEAKPVYSTVNEILERSPSTLIVATPTLTHYKVCRQILEDKSPPPRIVVEKPLGSTLEQVDNIFASQHGTEVDVIYHAAHAPEVLWAMEHWPQWLNSYGDVVGYDAFFSDPYRSGKERGHQSYVSSWVDSGINMLSVGYRFVELSRIDHFRVLDQDRSVFEASIRFKSGSREEAGNIRTSWAVPAPEKYSEFRLASGAIVRLDHRDISGVIRQGERIIDEFRYSGNTPRLELHYINAFRSLFVDKTGYYGKETSLHLHRLLFEYYQ
jgi:hypothetical protein